MKNTKSSNVNNISDIKIYSILSYLSFTDFILIGFYILLSIIVIGKIGIFSVFIFVLMMFSSIYFSIKYQYECNKIPVKNKKTKKMKSKMYKASNSLNKKNYSHSKLKEQL